MNAGQTCIACDYVLVHQDVRDKLVAKLKFHLNKALKCKATKIPNSEIGNIINEFHCKRIAGLLDGHGGKVLAGAKSSEEVNIEQKWVPPTIIENPDVDSPLMQEEIFGPVLPILSYKDFDEVVKFINDREKPLALYYFGSVIYGNWKRLQNETSSGALTVNDVLIHICNPDLPFGGVGNSGMGKYHGITGFRALSNAKAVLVKPAVNVWPFNTFMFPFTNSKKGIASFFFNHANMSQAKFIKGAIYAAILFWIFKGFWTGRF